MTDLNLNRAEFVLSAADPGQFIRSPLPKIAFAGRSNVGKSSVINRLLNRKKFAKVGDTPGKTIHVNYFLIDEKLYFVDLPGYGFARVSQAEKNRWSRLMESFFQNEACFDCGVLIVDARHKPTADDVRMADFFRGSGKPFLVAANKLDKLKKSEIDGSLTRIAETLGLDETQPPIPFSAEKGDGRETLFRALLTCL